MFKLPTKPQLTGEVIKNSAYLFKLCFPKIFYFILIDIALSILFHISMPQINSLEPKTIMLAMEDSFIFITFYAVITVMIHTAMFYQIGMIAKQCDLGISVSLLKSLQKLLPIMLATILYLVLIGIGLMIIIPGIILAVSLRFFTPLILFENVSVMDSLKISYQLVRGNWLRTLVVLAIPLLFSMSLGIIISGLFTNILIMQIVYLVVDKMLIPLFYAAILLQFYDLKLRNNLPIESNDFIA
ncbi:MAG: hypothetical protein KAH84_06830 [Thiomargarita sp.]|nr:hypothetical protein [Thiomargarita sp.]